HTSFSRDWSTDVCSSDLPGLATEWGLVDDGAAFELTLRDDVTFQDGEPVDAAAVVANLEAAAADGSNLASDLDVVASVEAVDERSEERRVGKERGTRR